MAGFKCPFCNQVMSISANSEATHRIAFNLSGFMDRVEFPYLKITIYKCPNRDCNEETIFMEGCNGYINNKLMLVYPRAIFRHFPEYVPFAIRSDYEEACTIIDDSPKAAATLARRCLQGMIHDFWDIHEKNLNAEITELKKHVPVSQWMAIDAIRSVGNVGAHMEHDVNRIIDVDPDEARKLIRLIEHLIEKWYVDRHDAEMLYADITEIGQEKRKAKKV